LLQLRDSWVWDSWFAFDGERHHAFYLRASRALGDPNRRHRHPFIGHAVSTDLKNWEVVSDAIAIGDAPAWDSWTTWTGSVTRDDDGLWWMFFTGTSREDGGDVQRVGAATSKDLMVWTKIEANPLTEADPEFYEKLDYDLWHDEAWRDPWVFRHEGTWHMIVTARGLEGSRHGRGVAGHAVSEDLKTWKVLPPLTECESGFGQMEVIQISEIEGIPTMLWCCGPNELSPEMREKYPSGGMFSTTGPSMLGPFNPNEAVWFPHETLYAARAVQHEGSWYMIGFIAGPDKDFGGYLCDPIPLVNSGRGVLPAVVLATR
jgi:beta-fructofuranosidase